MANTVCAIVSLVLLTLRNKLQIQWKNGYYHKQLQREALDSTSNDFANLDYSQNKKYSSIIKDMQTGSYEGGVKEHHDEDDCFDSFEIKNEDFFTRTFFFEILI